MVGIICGELTGSELEEPSSISAKTRCREIHVYLKNQYLKWK